MATTTIAATRPADTRPADTHDVTNVVVPGGKHHGTDTHPDDSTQTHADPATKPAEEPVSADPLSSPDAMLKALSSLPRPPEKSPTWDTLTADKRKAALETYNSDLAQWNKTHDFHKQQVKWRLNFLATHEGKNKDYLVLADTKRGAVVGLTFTQKDQEPGRVIQEGPDDRGQRDRQRLRQGQQGRLVQPRQRQVV